MKSSFVASALALVAPIFATPVAKRDNIDVTVLQFALTLEHLEDFFYSHGLRRIPESQFTALGYDKFYYNNLKRITDDEKSHVALLTAAIKANGATPVLECDYNFQYTNAKDFVTLSSILEGVGTSAYLGGAPLITDKGYLTVAGSILVTESLHTSYQRNAVGEVPFATPYGTPLDPTSVYSLAAGFITSCPDRASSLKLGFKPYPTLTAASSNAAAPIPTKSTVTFTSAADVPSPAYLTFVSGLDVISVQATVSGKTVSAAVPDAVAGQVYVVLTPKAADGKSLSSAGTPVAGPAIIEVAVAPPSFLN